MPRTTFNSYRFIKVGDLLGKLSLSLVLLLIVLRATDGISSLGTIDLFPSMLVSHSSFPTAIPNRASPRNLGPKYENDSQNVRLD